MDGNRTIAQGARSETFYLTTIRGPLSILLHNCVVALTLRGESRSRLASIAGSLHVNGEKGINIRREDGEQE